MSIKKMIREEIEDFKWTDDINPEPWEEFMFPYTELKGELEETKHGEMIVYRDKNGEWIFYHRPNPKNGYVWFKRGKIWETFMYRFGFNNIKTITILKKWLQDYYNISDVKPIYSVFIDLKMNKNFAN